jgi:hypothetical protein
MARDHSSAAAQAKQESALSLGFPAKGEQSAGDLQRTH